MKNYKQYSMLVTGLAIALGITFRIYFNFDRSWPLNDGGLFYSMIRDIQNNNYQIPKFTAYNQISIPLAYPPLSFYLTLIISKFLNISILDLMKYLPLFFSLASLPAFYCLAKEVLEKKYVPFAFLVFAVSERAFEFPLMGGGITRAPAIFYTMVALTFYIRNLKNGKPFYFFVACLFTTLVILSHLQWAFFLFLSAFIFTITSNNWVNKLKELITLGALSALFTMPWWYHVISTYGVSTLTNFLKTGSSFNLANIITFITNLIFAEEKGTSLIRVLVLIGTYYSFKKHPEFTFWLMLPIVLFPRSFIDMVFIPVSILAAIGLSETLVKISFGQERVLPSPFPHLGFLIILVIFSSISINNYSNLYVSVNKISNKNLREADFEAIEWINTNVTPKSKFLLLSLQSEPHSWGFDKISEWFPALTQQNSLSTPQGTEWLSNSTFKNRVGLYASTKYCYPLGMSCLQEILKTSQTEFVYLQRGNDEYNSTFMLGENLKSFTEYKKIYENPGVLIYKNNQ